MSAEVMCSRPEICNKQMMMLHVHATSFSCYMGAAAASDPTQKASCWCMQSVG